VEQVPKKKDFDKDILTPLRAIQAEEAQKEADAQAEALRQAPAAPEPSTTYTPATFISSSELVGSLGYTSPMSNCVDFVKLFRQVPFGNPIEWSPTTSIPFVGAVVLFPFNHTAYLTGIHSDGSIEVAHANCPGCATRYSQSEIRGYF
jgi:hypothetical protein